MQGTNHPSTSIVNNVPKCTDKDTKPESEHIRLLHSIKVACWFAAWSTFLGMLIAILSLVAILNRLNTFSWGR